MLVSIVPISWPAIEGNFYLAGGQPRDGKSQRWPGEGAWRAGGEGMGGKRGFVGDSLKIWHYYDARRSACEASMQYRFTNFSLDMNKYELSDGGAVRHVEPLVFDLLTFFVRKPGRVAGRDEIVSDVWGGRAVSDATISSCVKAARRALDDDGDAQTYIRTTACQLLELERDIAFTFEYSTRTAWEAIYRLLKRGPALPGPVRSEGRMGSYESVSGSDEDLTFVAQPLT